MNNNGKSIQTLGLTTAALMLVPALASAQPGDLGVPTPTPITAPTPAPDPVYTPPAPVVAQPVVAQPAQSVPTAAPVADAPVTPRPEGLSVGLGFQYLLGGAELSRPTGASARVRLPSGLAIEPFLRLATHSQSVQNGDIKDAQNEAFLGANVRYPLKSRGKVDLVAQAGAGFGVFSSDPDDSISGDNNSMVSSATVDYGISVEYWYNANWSLSFSAKNTLFNYVKTSQEVSDSVTSVNADFGLYWDPSTEISVHLYY